MPFHQKALLLVELVNVVSREIDQRLPIGTEKHDRSTARAIQCRGITDRRPQTEAFFSTDSELAPAGSHVVGIHLRLLGLRFWLRLG